MSRIIYYDSDYKCRASDDEAMGFVETDFFDGKCNAFIEGYRHIPAGSSWMREDGMVFKGEATFPWKPYSQLDAAQRAYEREQYEVARAAYAALDEGLTSV